MISLGVTPDAVWVLLPFLSAVALPGYPGTASLLITWPLATYFPRILVVSTATNSPLFHVPNSLLMTREIKA